MRCAALLIVAIFAGPAAAQAPDPAPAQAPAPAERPQTGLAPAELTDWTDPLSPFGPAPQAEADADAQARARNSAQDSARCQQAVAADPVAGRELARDWAARGGGVPAAVCEALALEAQGAAATAAQRLENAAETAPEASLPSPARAALYEVAAGFRLRALQPEQALEAADAGLALEGAGPILARLRAEALAALSRPDEALAALDQALAAAPRDLPGLILRARLRLETNQPEGAAADAGRALALQEGAPDLWLLLGQAQARAGQRAQARESLLRAVALDREGRTGDRARRALQTLAN